MHVYVHEGENECVLREGCVEGDGEMGRKMISRYNQIHVLRKHDQHTT